MGRIVDPGGNLKLAKFEPIIEKSVAITNCDESGYDPNVTDLVCIITTHRFERI